MSEFPYSHRGTRKEMPLEDRYTALEMIGADNEADYTCFITSVTAARPIEDPVEAQVCASTIQELSKFMSSVFMSDLVKTVGVDGDELAAMSGIMQMIELLAKRLYQWEH